MVMPLFDSSDPARRLGRLNVLFPRQRLSRARRLLEIAGGGDHWRHPWTRACATRLLVEQEHRDEVEGVMTVRSVDERFTCEVLLWGLYREDLYESMCGYPEVLRGIIHELCNRLRGKRAEGRW